jgi:hypothetical protein
MFYFISRNHLFIDFVNVVLVVVLLQNVHHVISVNFSMVVQFIVGYLLFFFFFYRCLLSSDGFFPNNQVKLLAFFLLFKITFLFCVFYLAINPAKRQYLTQQSSIVQNDVYAVMHNCPVPYCTYPSPATTINTLYLTYHDYSATQITSNANISPIFSFIFFVFLNLFMYFNQRI